MSSNQLSDYEKIQEDVLNFFTKNKLDVSDPRFGEQQNAIFALLLSVKSRVEALGRRNADPWRDYQEAKETVSYRLSEIMFGSLLAAFVLGFFSISSSIGKIDVIPIPILNHLVIYLPISLSYAYLTGATYVLYHSNILTVPDFNFSCLSWDYLFALGLGICFGSSMLFPVVYPFTLSLIYLLGLWRQDSSYRQLEEFLVRQYIKDDSTNRAGITKEFRARVPDIINSYEIMNTCWKRPGKLSFFWSVVFLLVAIFLICGLFIFNWGDSTSNEASIINTPINTAESSAETNNVAETKNVQSGLSESKEILICCINSFVAVFVIVICFISIKRQSEYINGKNAENKFTRQFRDFEIRLKETAKECEKGK